MDQKQQIIMNFINQIAPLVTQYQQAKEEEQKYANAKMRREQLEQQLMGMGMQITMIAQQLQQVQPSPNQPGPFPPTGPTVPPTMPSVPNPNNWPICPETGLPYNPAVGPSR